MAERWYESRQRLSKTCWLDLDTWSSCPRVALHTNAGLLAAIQSRGLKQVDEDIAKATPQSSSTDKTKEPSSTTEKDEPKSTKAIQDGQYDTFKTVVTKGSALESTKDTDLDIAKDTRKSSKEENTTKENDYVISSYGNVSQQSQTYKRKQSAGQPVNRTTLLSCK